MSEQRGSARPAGSSGPRRVGARAVVRAAVLAAVLATVAGVLVWSPWSASEPATAPAPPGTTAPPPPPTVWSRITDGIRADGSVPKDVALAAYAYLHQVDLPGVEVPEGVDGDDYPRSGTGAVRWLQANWPDLTEVQRRAILEENGATASLPGAGGRTRASAWRRQPGPAYREFVDAELRSALDRLSQRLGLPAIGEFAVRYHQSLGGNTLMETAIETTTYTVNGRRIYRTDPTPCNVTIFAFVWNQGLTPQTRSMLHVLLTHEAVHCYQNTIWDTPARAETKPAWISEGTATFLATDDAGYGEPGTASYFRDGYINLLSRDLFTRNYDAVGFYALLQHLGRDLWGTMANAWRAAATSNSQSEAFIAVLNGDAEDVRAQWGPSYGRRNDWGDPWVMYGVGLPDGTPAPAYAQSVPQGGGFTDQLPSRANRLYAVDAVADEVLTVSTATGRAAVHDDDHHADYGFLSNQFCMRGECVCPPDTPNAGKRLAADPLRAPFTLTFTSEPGGGAIDVHGESLEQACGKQRRREAPTPPSPPCPGGRCGQSNGDPHLVTLDQTGYEFQAAGEFVLLRTDDFELQARQEPVEDLDGVSMNTAVAARAGETTVAIYQSVDGTTLRVDGEQVESESTRDLGEGTTLAAYPGGYELGTADGTTVYVVGVPPWGLNVLVVPSDALVDDAAGLLARTGGGFQVPALADGSELPRARDDDERYAFLYRRLAGSWRVTDRTSLFDYASGESTGTFTVRGFPERADLVPWAAIPAPDLDAAAGACEEVGDSRLREQCTYDVAVTGDAEYASNYRASGALMTVGPTVLRQGGVVEPDAPATTGPAATSTTLPEASIEPVLTDIDGVPAQGVAIGPDGAVYAGVVDGERRRIVKIVDGEVVQEAGAPNVGWLGFAAGSLWVGNYGDDACRLGRLDPRTLEPEVVVDAGCGFLSGFGLGPQFTVAGDAVWFTGAGPGDEPGVQRVDPRTNRPERGVARPPSSYLAGSDDALFAFDAGALFRLEVDGSEFDDWSELSAFVPFFPDDSGVWVTDGAAAAFYEEPGAPARTVEIGDGSLVAAGGGSLFVERTDDEGRSTLWRVDASGGGTAEQVGPPTTVVDRAGNPVDLSYFADPRVIVSPAGPALKYWVVPAPRGDRNDVYLRVFPG